MVFATSQVQRGPSALTQLYGSPCFFLNADGGVRVSGELDGSDATDVNDDDGPCE